MKRASAARAAVAPAVRQPRREALLRSGIALAVALVLGVSGLLFGERGGERPAAIKVGQSADQAVVPASPVQTPSASGTSSLTTGGVAVTAAPLSAPSPGSDPASGLLSVPPSAPVSGSLVAAPIVSAPPAVAPPEGGAAGLVRPVSAAPEVEVSAGPDAVPDGVLLPHAALRSGGPGYRIQLGVFGDAGNALKLYEQVAAQGFEAHIQSRVMVGPFADRAAAEKARQALRRAGVVQGAVVTPEPSK